MDVKPDISHSAEMAQVQASADLVVDLRQMVNKPAFSDVVFVCKDGKRVHGLRLLLAGRSDVLKSMFMNGMAESKFSEIKLPEISSPALLSVLEFLYTGTLLDYNPQSWRMACEIIISSRFFLLPNLEMITRKFMHKQLSAAPQDLPMAASLLTEAMEFKSLCDGLDVNLMELVKILNSNWSDPKYIRQLSEDAFHYLLANSKSLDSVDDNKLSFKEYLCFRQVIRWWVYRSSDVGGSPRSEELVDFIAPDGSPGAEEVVNFIAPDEKRALSLCRRPDKVERPENPLEDPRFSNEWSSFQLKEASSRNSAIRLLSNIDFRWIHPTLLVKVVEPLKIVSSAEILKGFRFHALRRPMIFDTLECGWEHGESHGILEQGYVIQKTAGTIGAAVMKVAMSSSNVVYQWRFIVEEMPALFFQLGILYDTGGFGAQPPSFDGGKLSDLFQARVMDISAEGGGEWRYNWSDNKQGPFGWKELSHALPNRTNSLLGGLSKGSTVLFNYNSYARTCAVIVDGKDCGMVWKDLPKAISYPAVSLGRYSGGRVRIEFLSGFNIL